MKIFIFIKCIELFTWTAGCDEFLNANRMRNSYPGILISRQLIIFGSYCKSFGEFKKSDAVSGRETNDF